MNKKPIIVPDNATVPMAFVLLLYEFLGAEALPSKTILGQPELGKENRPLDPFPASMFVQLLGRASQHLADPLLGLRLGQNFHVSHFGALGNVLETSDCLGDALQRIQRFYHLMHDTNDMNVQILDGHMILEWPEVNGRYGPLYDEMGVAAFVQCFRELTGRDERFPQIEFNNDRPDQLGPYKEYFGGKVLFGQTSTRIHMPVQYLGMPFKSGNPDLCKLLETEVDSLQGEKDRLRSLESSVRRAITRRAYLGLPSLKEAAEELDCTVRQLREQLKSQGRSFRTIRNDVIRILAQIHLADRQLNVADVASLLGYSEQSAFTRAFRSWTGESPKSYQQTLH